MKNYLLSLLATTFLCLCVSCDETAPCSLTLCANGGTCVDGDCQCADGYGGSNCQELSIPTLFLIKEISISGVPMSDENGDSFDESDGPDLYMVITETPSGTTFTSPSVFENANSVDTYLFEMGSGFEVKATSAFVVEFFDADPGGQDTPISLADGDFNAQQLILKGGGYTSPYTFTATAGGAASIQVVVDWGF